MTRSRSPALRAPQTLEQATVLLGRYAAADAAIAGIEADRRAQLAHVNATADVAIAPLAAELADIVKQVKPWWAANYETVTGGKRKSIELGGCLIGYRISPPKVHFAGGNDDVAVDALIVAGRGDELVRTKLSLDKPAILKLLEGDDAAPLAVLGFSIRQPESFFVDAIASGLALDGVIAGAAAE